jgi:hypothetical protein
VSGALFTQEAAKAATTMNDLENIASSFRNVNESSDEVELDVCFSGKINLGWMTESLMQIDHTQQQSIITLSIPYQRIYRFLPAHAPLIPAYDAGRMADPALLIRFSLL